MITRLYLLCALLLVGIFYGIDLARYRLVVSVPLSTILFGFAAAGCLIAAILPDRARWRISGVLTAAAVAWRAVSALVVGLRDDGARLAAFATSSWLFMLLGVWALWTRVLRPGGIDAP